MKKCSHSMVLKKLFKEAPVIKMNKNGKMVIFSDLHMGDGNKKDDFSRNVGLFSFVLKKYYLPHGYRLVLNGDIEELKKFHLKKITEKWIDIYSVFNDFHNAKNLFRIAGNHDNTLLNIKKDSVPCASPLKAIKMVFGENTIFVFHGHQASLFFEKYDIVSTLLLRYIATPLGIKNYSVSHDSLKKFKIEKKVYHFSSKNKVISIIGHTHRPLFESLSKIDSIKFKIEHLCRKYTEAKADERQKIEKDIRYYKNELNHTYKNNYKNGSNSSLYNANLLIPCLFNSGTVIGKRGITSIEIADNSIALVHWFNRNRTNKHFSHNGGSTIRIGKSDIFRLILKKENLDYIFTRIKLLA